MLLVEGRILSPFFHLSCVEKADSEKQGVALYDSEGREEQKQPALLGMGKLLSSPVSEEVSPHPAFSRDHSPQRGAKEGRGN